MRNLKRVFSLVMACAMLLSLMVFTASAAEDTNPADFTDRDEITNIEAVDVLVTLNVIDGKDDGSYDPTGIVTRAEMAKMIAVVLNGGEDPLMGSEATTMFTDTANHWARAYISYCTNLGIISGRGDGTFDPDATVTGVEAAKMILVALGYDSDVFGFTGAGWDASVNVQANTANLYDGMSGVNLSEGLNRDNTAQMLYNGLDSYIMERSYDRVLNDGTISYNYNLSEYKTLLNHTYGAYRVEGIVVANEYADLGGDATPTAMREGTTSIIVTNPDELRTASNTYALTVGTRGNDDPEQTDYSQANTFNISTSAEELGQTVTLFVRPATSSSVTSRGTVLGDAVISGDSVTVTRTNNMKDTDAVNTWLRENSLRLDAETVLVTDYNTSVSGGNDFDSFAAVGDLDALGNGATVSAIDNDNDGTADFVFITNYTFTKVASINTANDQITLTGMAAKDMEDVVAYEDIAKDDYVISNEAGGRLYIAEPETITGEISAYTYNGTSEDSVTIAGTKLNLSAIRVNAAESGWSVISANRAGGLSGMSWTSSLIDTETTIYLDANGYAVVMGDSSSLSAENICLVIKKSAANVMGTGCEVYVCFADGSKGTYTVTSVNGSSQGMMAAITELSICSYDLDGDNISLRSGTGLNVAGQTGTVTTAASQALAISAKGQSQLTIGSTTAYANNDTVYFLVNSNEGFASKDYVTVVTGMSSVGANTYTAANPVVMDPDTNTSAGAQIVYNINGANNLAVGVLGVKNSPSTAAYASDLIFMIDTAYEMQGQTKLVNVIMPGETEVSQLLVDRNEAQAVGLYEYSIGADGVYDLQVVSYGNTSSDPTYAGRINCVNDDVVILGSEEIGLTEDTLIIDATDDDNPVVINANDLRGLTPYGYVYYDSDENATAIYVTGFYATLTSFGGVTVTPDASMGTQSDPLVVNLPNTVTGFAFDATDTNKLTAGYTVPASAVNEDVQVFSNSGFSTGAGSITTGTYYVTVAADNAQTVYYAITIAAPTTVTISTHPTAGPTYYAVNGTAAALTVNATDSNSGTVTYQWEASTDSTNGTDGTWSNAAGTSTNANYTPAVTTAGTTWYRCVVTSEDGTANTTSNAAQVVVYSVEASGSTEDTTDTPQNQTFNVTHTTANIPDSTPVTVTWYGTDSTYATENNGVTATAAGSVANNVLTVTLTENGSSDLAASTAYYYTVTINGVEFECTVTIAS